MFDTNYEHKCTECGYPISGEMYGAGDDAGQKFICSGCYWEHKYNVLKKDTDILKEKIKMIDINI